MSGLLQKERVLQRQSLWLQTLPPAVPWPLAAHKKTEVVIVGAGITGLTAAYLLLLSGRRVVVVDSGLAGGGDTGHTSAHLTAWADPGYGVIEKKHGKAAARLVFQCHLAAMGFMETLINKEKIACDFCRVDGYLCLGENQERHVLEREWKALQAIGDTSCKQAAWIENSAAGPFRGRPAIRLPSQARFHPLRYLDGLTQAVLALGGEIYTATPVSRIEHDGVRTASGFCIQAQYGVIATHSPVAGTLIFLKQAAYRTYVTAARIPKGSLPDALYWDTEDPYHYVRLEPFSETEDLVIAGGYDHKTGQSDEAAYAARYEQLEAWTRRHIEGAGVFEYQWSGQILETIDGLPYIGRIAHHGLKLYMATGYSGNGLTYGTAAGLILQDLISGQKSSWTGLFELRRKKISAGWNFLKENLNIFQHWAGDKIKPEETQDAETLKPGEGAIIQKGLHKMAAARDKQGVLRKFSAVCPHLGCIVQWNPAEQTFDCPCHGSRFSGTGRVIQGPALRDLKNERPDVPRQAP